MRQRKEKKYSSNGKKRNGEGTYNVHPRIEGYAKTLRKSNTNSNKPEIDLSEQADKSKQIHESWLVGPSPPAQRTLSLSALMEFGCMIRMPTTSNAQAII